MPRLHIGRLICALALALVSAPVTAAQAGRFTLTSTDITPGGTIAAGQVFNSFGCTGGNISPQLSWSGAPAGTRSFVLTLFDPDAPTGSGFWHWVVANIPAGTTSIPRGASRDASRMPKGAIETRTDFGAPGYGGPCPPAGDTPHRYVFTIHALKVDTIDVDAGSSGALVGFMTHQNSLGSATLTANYGR
jgi:Raf kinase inhibitor-like YbhB/YbcL family protein